MFSAGNLLRFDPFLFKNGAKPKPKYFIVLDSIADGQLLLASLPTSKDHIPADVACQNGCVEIPERNINVYALSANVPVTICNENGECFSFSRNTFIYGADIDTYVIKDFELQVSEGNTIVTLLGTLNSDLFDDIKRCLANSASVKRKYKRILG